MIITSAIKYNDLICVGKNHADILFNIIKILIMPEPEPLKDFLMTPELF